MTLGQPLALGDGELVKRARQRDAGAFAELLERTSPSPIRQAMRILHNREEAEDEVQNSYVKAWEHIGQFQGDSRFSTWLSRIVMNQCLMRLRKLRRKSFLHLDSVTKETGHQSQTASDHNQSPEFHYDRRERWAQLKREIDRLPPLFREVVILRDLHELKSEEVADRLSISKSAVKSRLLRARVLLRVRMDLGVGISAARYPAVPRTRKSVST